MDGLPSGTVTFLFTDIEGSTPLWDAHPDTMGLSLARHDEILRTAPRTPDRCARVQSKTGAELECGRLRNG